MPAELRNREADNWRPLIAIADACGPEWGARAREAAIAFSRAHHDEDIVVTLLHHIRQIFNARAVDRIPSKMLVEDLCAMDDAECSEWRGLHGDQQPRKLTQAVLASLLRPFGIRPRTIWPAHRTTEAKGPRGYYCADFEAAWASYCDGGATPPQRREIRRLRGV